MHRQSYNYVENFIASTPTLPAAVSLCKLLCCIAAKVDEEETDVKTGIIKQILAQVKQIIVTNALCYQLPDKGNQR